LGSAVEHFGESEISDFDVGLGIQENVFWLEIPVDDIVAMQVLEGKQNLSCIKLGHFLLEALRFAEQIE